MNIASYWRMKPIQLLAAQFLPWRGFYRPMGGLFYLPLLHVFGLNPLPYHLAQLMILAANVYLVYRLATLLHCAPLVSGIAAWLTCYHAGIANITYNTAFVYDVLCGFFYLAALVWYFRIRETGRTPRARELAIFLSLHLCALNSKEMAVTLPVMVLVYEWLYQTRRTLTPVLLAAGLNVLHIYGVALRPNALATQFAYHPVFSLDRIASFQTHAFGDLFERWNYFQAPQCLAIWTMLFYFAFRRRRPELRFAWLLLAIVPLPIEFLPNRGGACLYIPSFGWAILMAALLVDLARAVAAFLADDPVFRLLGRRAWFALLVLGAVFLWTQRTDHMKESYVKGAMAAMGQQAHEMIREMHDLNPKVHTNSTVVFLNDPFVDWDMAFIAELWFRDRSLNIKLHRKTPFDPVELAAAEHVFDYRNGRLIQIR